MKHWLMKAEPDSRIVKGKDVKVRMAVIHHGCTHHFVNGADRSSRTLPAIS
jgi:hypothetical protein